jgi:hypothetical protein
MCAAKNLLCVPIAAAEQQKDHDSLACYKTSLRLNGTSLFRSILVGRNFRHIPRWLDYRRWRHNFRFLFLRFGVHNVAFTLLTLGVNRLLKLTFLARAGSAPLRPGAMPNVFRVPSTLGRALGNKTSPKQETVMIEADLFQQHAQGGHTLVPPPNPRAQMRGTHLVNLACRYAQGALLSEGHHVF